MTAPTDLADDALVTIEKAATAAKNIADFDHAALAAYVVAVNPTVLLSLVATVRDAHAALREIADRLPEDHQHVKFHAADCEFVSCVARRALATPAPVAVPATRLCPCGELACAGVDDDANHQCGGPREACGAMGCQECAVPDPVQAIQREGSITHADLMAIRERYGALYAAVFPIVPTLLCMFIERSSSPSDRKSAREAFAQVEACK